MGCKMKKKFNVLSSNAKKIMLAVLISMIWITTLTPVVLAGTTTNITISFNPAGVISIAVSPSSYNFSAIMAGGWKNSTPSIFTIFNNGTIGMDTQMATSATSSGGMVLDDSGSPGANQYSLLTDGLSSDAYLTAANVTRDTNLASSGTKPFDLCLNMGSTITQNWTWQTATVYFVGSSV
jgi:hypothetical protein